MQLETVRDTAHEHVTDFKPVPALLHAALQPTLLVQDATFNDTIPDRFPNDILSIFFRVEVKLNADIPEGDTRV